MWAAGKADSVTWTGIWNAVEAEIADTRKDLADGSDAFYKAVGKRFTEIIDRTQVVDSVMHRTQFMRSSKGLNQLAASFMSEPSKVYNMAVNSFYDLKKEAKASPARTAAQKQATRTFFALSTSFAVNAIAQSLIDAARDDDKEKEYWEKFLSNWGSNFAGNYNPVSYLPYFKDIQSILSGYDVARMDMEGISKTIGAIKTMGKALSGEGKYNVKYAMTQLLADGSRLFGLPVANIKRDVMAFINTVAQETDNYLLQYGIDAFFMNFDTNAGRKSVLDTLFLAMENDPDAYEIIYDKLVSRGITVKEIEDAMKERYKKKSGKEHLAKPDNFMDIAAGYNVSGPKESEPALLDEMSNEQQRVYYDTSEQTFNQVMDMAMEHDALVGLSPEAVDKLRGAVFDYAEEQAKAAATGGDYKVTTKWIGWADGGEQAGVDTAEAILFKLAYDVAVSDKDTKGKTVSGSKKENTLEEAKRTMPWLTQRELRYLKSNYWK